MRTYLVPTVTVLFGLAVMTTPSFIPLGLYEATLPDDLIPLVVRAAARAAVTSLGVVIVLIGLYRGLHHLRHPGSTSRIETGIGSASAAALLALLTLATAPAFALSLGEMAQEAGEDLEVVPFFISIAFYILGIVIVGFGLIRLKRHVDQPAQTTIGSGIIALIIGTALLVAPSVINAVGETFGVDATATLSRPALD